MEMDQVLTFDNKGKFLLLELPVLEIPSYTLDIIYELLQKEITPIIPHPERNRAILGNVELIYELVQVGALIQITSGSILGHYGKKVQTFSEKIIKYKLVHFISTDAHNYVTRGFNLKEAYEMITRKLGIQYTFYLKENAELLLLGQNLQIEEPIPPRKRFLGVL